MKQAAIITVGNELLSGFTVDTNAAFLGRRCWELGVPLATTLTVPDEIDRIVTALDRACDDADLVLITGGLGPTDDDLTRHALARFLGVELTLRPHYVEHLRRFFAERHYEMPERNLIQAQLPEGTEGIDNPLGTAPGILARQGDKVFVAMPGVPTEMKAMFEGAVVPLARAQGQDRAIVIERLRCFGIGESTLAERLGDRMQRGRNPLINCTVDYGLLTLHVVVQADSEAQARRLAEREIAVLHADLGQVVYGVGDETLAQVVGRELLARGQTLATAESCTGGWVAKLLTDVPGASGFFTHGWVTYSNEAKISQLGVSADLLAEHGAVSEAVVRAMAQGACQRAGSDYSLAITGIAGPDGGTPDKPVGLVYVSIGTPTGCRVERYQFAHDRDFVRSRTSRTALNELRKALAF